MQQPLLDMRENLTAQNASLRQLLDFVYSQLDHAMERCKSTPLSSDGTKDLRLVNIAGFAAELKGDLDRKRTELEIVW